MVSLPTAKDLLIEIAEVESEKASIAMKAHAAAEAEHQAFIDRISKPSGLTDDQCSRRRRTSSRAPFPTD